MNIGELIDVLNALKKQFEMETTVLIEAPDGECLYNVERLTLQARARGVSSLVLATGDLVDTDGSGG